ncbi:MAG: electron transfer flavoprotein subunit beta/FixA family protein [Bacteroidales bacterium]|jgi:electron transfer flavoprotein beta subunit
MKTLVCLSIVPDTTTNIRFTGKMDALDTTGIQWIINPWDELALTRALEIREQAGSGVTQVSVIHVGLKESDPVIQKALAVGADSAFRVNYSPADSMEVALQIAEVIKKDHYDLVITGYDSADYNGSATGGMLAELVGWTSFTSISSLSVSDSMITLERESDNLTETIAAKSPCVLTIQKGIAKDPRIPSLRGIMTARTKPLTVIEPSASDPGTRILTFENPAPRSKCRMVDPSNVDELVNLLRNEANVL